MPNFTLDASAISKRYEITKKVIINMENKNLSSKSAKMQCSVMLAGDPGTGKTSFVKAFCKLLGINEIIIEAPHITEEHLINIPFIVYNPIKNKSANVDVRYDPKTSRVVLADSHLFTNLNKMALTPEEKYLATIYDSSKTDALTRRIFEKFGGNKNTIPPRFIPIRERFQGILFVDEYFRQTSPRIRNILRTILNGQIGQHDLPKHIYVMYASNMKDTEGSLSEIQSNNQFKMVTMEAATEKEWFAWMEAKYEGVNEVNLNPDILNAFYKMMTTTEVEVEGEDVTDDDGRKVKKGQKVKKLKKFLGSEVENNTMVSPRRWEQIILYVNASLPVKEMVSATGKVIRSKEDCAKDLLANIKTNFRNYLEGTEHSTCDEVLKLVAKLIEKTSDIKVSPNKVTDEYDWRNIISHQISVKKAAGRHRTYIPVMSGPPGIGKTSIVAEISEHHNMLYIPIDCSTLNPEDVTGMPLSKASKDDFSDVEVNFSEPSLWILIANKIAKEYENMKKRWEEIAKTSKVDAIKAKKSFNTQKYKALIFFDELNRVKSASVFNALRRVLLEKEFNERFNLGQALAQGLGGDVRDVVEAEEGCLCIAAINPSDVGGVALELTMHVRDVLDIVKTSPSWSQVVSLFENKLNLKDHYDKSAVDLSMEAIRAVTDAYKTKESKIPNEQRQFYLSSSSDIYVSPRSYTDLYRDCSAMINEDIGEITDDSDPQEVRDQILRTMCECFDEHLSLPMKIAGVDAPEFLENVHITLSGLEINVFKEKIDDLADFGKVLAKWRKKPSIDFNEFPDLYNYFAQSENAKITDDIWRTLSPLVEELDSTPNGDESMFATFVKGLIHAADGTFNEKLEAIEAGIYYAADDYYGPIFNVINSAPTLDEAALEPILVMDKVLSAVSDVVHPG